jgi:hypothetical protein
MSELQKRFDGLLALLHKNFDLNALAAECYIATEGEFALTAPAETAQLPSAKIMAEILSLNIVNQVNISVSNLISDINKAPDADIAVWYIDTDQGQYIIVTNPAVTTLVGIAKTETTLTSIRKRYFLQKEIIEKMGDTLPFDYGKTENSFYNRKLIA